MGKKKFIDQKTSTTIQLMAHDSTDPVSLNPTMFSFASTKILVPSTPSLPIHPMTLMQSLTPKIDLLTVVVHYQIKNTGGGANFFSNPKFKREHVSDVKANNALRVRVKEAMEKDPEENTLYNFISHTANIRVQKVVDPEVVALLDDNDVSRFGSNVEYLERDRD
ncbi:hypothetical protein RYX36_008154 [Vicia faba]